MSAALRLVQAPQFREQIDVDAETSTQHEHSLHSSFTKLSPWRPLLVRHLVERYSEKGCTVLDPFCAAGTTGIETALLGRHFIGATSDAGLALLALARLQPADIAEVALKVQLTNLKRPIDVRHFASPFPQYYDVDTFCELLVLRSLLRGSSDRVDRFVQFIVASILHGHTVAHLSGYTSPHVALSPEAQADLNRKRGEVPSYRAVVPRILRKAAGLLRDGVPSALQRTELLRSVSQGDARNLAGVKTSSVDLALVCPEQPGAVDYTTGSWLRNWWLGTDQTESSIERPADIECWKGYANEVLFETARTVRRGGRAVIRVTSGRPGTKIINYKEQLLSVLNECLGAYWMTEGSIVERHVASESKTRNDRATPTELVVLRRR